MAPGDDTDTFVIVVCFPDDRADFFIRLNGSLINELTGNVFVALLYTPLSPGRALPRSPAPSVPYNS